MKTFRVALLPAAIFLILPAIAPAQMPGMSPWWDGPIARNLGLSDDQTGQIRSIVRDSRDHLIQLRAAVQSAEADLEDQMNEEKVDGTRAEAAIDKVVSARSELMKAVSMMSLRLRMTLTAAQWRELERRQGRLGGRLPRRGDRMGGPGRSLKQ